MSLYIHYGSAGSGKTYNMIETTLKQAEKEPYRNFFVLVPEQFTLSTQRAFIDRSPVGGIMNIDVLSFTRLAGRIFDELGGNKLAVLEDTGKSMIVRRLLAELRDELTVYGANASKQGFVDEVKSVIAEFYQYNVGEEELDRMIADSESKPLMHRKLLDIRKLYLGFRDFLKERYITNEELLDAACARVPDSKALCGSVLYLDGFTGFTPSQYKFIEALMRSVKDIHVSLTMPEDKVSKELPEYDLFHLSFKTATKLRKLAAECGIDEKITSSSGVPVRFAASPALAHLESSIFRPAPSVYKEKQDSVVLFAAKNMREEVSMVTGEIKRLLRAGVKGREIAIVSGDVSSYGRFFSEEFDNLSIPYFIDEKRSVLSSPLVELVRSGVSAILKGYSYESVFRFVKCSLSPLTRSESDTLENYCIAFGIRGKSMWSMDWVRVMEGSPEYDLAIINESRRKVFSALAPLEEVLSTSKVKVSDALRAVYTFASAIIENPDAERISFASEQDERDFNKVSAMFSEMLDRLNMLMGEESMPPEEFAAILDTGFNELKLRPLPPSPDSIIIGDIERSRLEGISVLFFAGVNDSIMLGGGSGGVLSDAEREFLLANGTELAPTGRQKAFLSEYYLYLNITKPSEKLYLSYSVKDNEGKPVRPSYLCDKVAGLFQYIRRQDGSDHSGEGDREKLYDELLGSDKGFSSLMRFLRDGSDEPDLTAVGGTLAALFSKEEPRRVEKVLSALDRRRVLEGIEPDHAERLYGQILSGSITRLEAYARCAFAHFCNYGLKLSERKRFEVNAADFGNVYHKAIELYGRFLRDAGMTWAEADPGIRESFIAKGIEEAVKEYQGGVFKSTARNEFSVMQLTKVVKRTVDNITEQIAAGSMEPEFFEENFTHLGEYLALRGKIDRMDVCEKNGKLFLRVIDYKSGKKNFELEKLYYGLQIQLMVYLDEGMRLSRESLHRAGKDGLEVIPAGIYYYNIDDPIVDECDDPEIAVRKELRMKGLSNSAPSSLGVQDETLIGPDDQILAGAKSLVIPVEVNKDGRWSVGTRVADTAAIDTLADYVRKGMQDAAEHILKGDASAKPYRLKDETGCDYCGFSDICGFDRYEPGEYRELTKKTDAEVLEDICRTENGQNSSRM